MIRRQASISAIVAATVTVLLAIPVLTQRRTEQPARDTPAQPSEPAPAAKGRIAGRVLASDTGRPVRRARVFVSAAELPGGRGVTTDENGSYELTELPAGRYTVSVSKTGFISLSYGQRRPLQAGTPLQLADGQQLSDVNFSLPRGSVIAGRIFDEMGDPVPGAFVQVMRYQYAQGNRQLVPAGGAQTDDQGYFRTWGLNPGEYYVNAVSRNFDLAGPGFFFGFAGAVQGRMGPGLGRGAVGLMAGGPDAQDQPAVAVVTRGPVAAMAGPPAPDAEPVAYAPTFYPGVPSENEARPITVGLSAEVLDVNFSLLLVQTARIDGRLTNADGSATGGGLVTLMPEATQAARGGPGRTFGSRVQRDGIFSIVNVPPGRYVLRARGGTDDRPEFAAQPLAVSEGNISNVIVVLQPGATITGTITFQSTQSATLPDVNQVRIAAPATDFINLGPNPVARVDRQGAFVIEGVSAGLHWIRPQGTPRGWALKSVQIAGREMIDTPIEVRAGQKLSGVTLLFTDRLSEVNGTVTDNRGTPITELTVLAFPTDPALWRPQARQIMTARPDQNGKYQIRGLPPGDYFLATVDPAEQGEWFEPAFLDQHRAEAVRIALAEGDVKSQDFRLSPR
jgi:hypothetical protein